MYTRVVLLPAAIVALTLRSSPVSGDSTSVYFKWQTNCDFVGGDLKSVEGVSSKCGHLCVNEAKCTHWSWTHYNRGTCWLKQNGTASISMSAGQGFCGYVTDRVSISNSTQNFEQNSSVLIELNSTQVEQNPIQIEQNPVKIELSPVQIELNSTQIELNPAKIEQTPAKIEQKPAESTTLIEQKSVPKADPLTSYTFEQNPAQIEQISAQIEVNPEQNPIQTSLLIEQKPDPKAGLPTSWTFEQNSAQNEQTPAKIEQKPAENTTHIKQKPVQKADLPTSWTFKQNPVQIKQTPAQVKQPPAQIEINPAQTEVNPEQNPVQTSLPIEQKPDQKAGPPTSWTFEQIPAQVEQNPAQVEQTPAQTKQPPVQTKQPPAQPPAQTEQPPAQTEQPPVQIEQNPAQIEQNPAQIEVNPAQTEVSPEQNPVQTSLPIEQKPDQKAGPPTSGTFDNGLTTAENAEMLSSINSHRADSGLAPLTIDNRLAAAALVHSQYQAKNCVMQHGGTNGSTPGERITSQNYSWSYSAENVAAGQANVSEVMTSWWNSEHHRDNILRVTVTQVGFALVANEACEYKRYWTQDFGAEETA